MESLKPTESGGRVLRARGSITGLPSFQVQGGSLGSRAGLLPSHHGVSSQCLCVAVSKEQMALLLKGRLCEGLILTLGSGIHLGYPCPCLSAKVKGLRLVSMLCTRASEWGGNGFPASCPDVTCLLESWLNGLCASHKDDSCI